MYNIKMLIGTYEFGRDTENVQVPILCNGINGIYLKTFNLQDKTMLTLTQKKATVGTISFDATRPLNVSGSPTQSRSRF